MLKLELLMLSLNGIAVLSCLFTDSPQSALIMIVFLSPLQRNLFGLPCLEVMNKVSGEKSKHFFDCTSPASIVS